MVSATLKDNTTSTERLYLKTNLSFLLQFKEKRNSPQRVTIINIVEPPIYGSKYKKSISDTSAFCNPIIELHHEIFLFRAAYLQNIVADFDFVAAYIFYKGRIDEITTVAQHKIIRLELPGQRT